jgi:hypothetical protein
VVWNAEKAAGAKIAATVVFGVLMGILLWVGSRKEKPPPA